MKKRVSKLAWLLISMVGLSSLAVGQTINTLDYYITSVPGSPGYAACVSTSPDPNYRDGKYRIAYSAGMNCSVLPNGTQYIYHKERG
ncbi:MAG: hypothetical protein HY232_04545 [Acidobacteria bacterium]|nr:hypothetical protein [Acidobacteriota bacterium]